MAPQGNTGPSKVGSLRSSQLIYTYGPGALIDLPKYSAIVAGLASWRPRPGRERRVSEPRLAAKLQSMLGLPSPPTLFLPPPDEDESWRRESDAAPGYVALRRFPRWFVVQTASTTGSGRSESTATSRRLVRLEDLDHRDRYENLPVVATRFVRACRKGHVDDLDWRSFVGCGKGCMRRLWLDEASGSGDLGDLIVRCDCGAKRRLGEAADRDKNCLGRCAGKRPWLGESAAESCRETSRLLVRTATNAYFSQVVRVLSIPETENPIDEAVGECWENLQAVSSPDQLPVAAQFVPPVARLLDRFSRADIMEAIERRRAGGETEQRGIKQMEVNALVNAREEYGDDIPIDDNFHARTLPDSVWRKTGATDFIGQVVQVHRLREVSALAGFTRFEAAMPDIDGEFATDVSRAAIDETPWRFPAVENRGEGVFVALDPEAVREWTRKQAVEERVANLRAGHKRWLERREGRGQDFPGGPYILLHTLSHLLLQAIAIRCGYPATSIRERIYLGQNEFGILIYTASSGGDGTLGGLVQQARHIEAHLLRALRVGGLCSSDPICAQHSPAESLDDRWLHGAACHSCSLVAETSCEMRNEFLDRALVVPTIDTPNAAFFESVL